VLGPLHLDFPEQEAANSFAGGALRVVASHGAYFGRRLVELAETRKEAGDSEKAQILALRRQRLQRLSFGISMLNVLISAAVVILATYAQAG
jgi:hypothetical protein